MDVRTCKPATDALVEIWATNSTGGVKAVSHICIVADVRTQGSTRALLSTSMMRHPAADLLDRRLPRRRLPVHRATVAPR